MPAPDAVQSAFRLWLADYGRVSTAEIIRRISESDSSVTPDAAEKMQHDFQNALTSAYEIWRPDYEAEMLADIEMKLQQIAPWLDDSNLRSLWRLACWCRAKGG
jgi:hypothetical protein